MEEKVVDHAGTSVEETPNPQRYSVNRSNLQKIIFECRGERIRPTFFYYAAFSLKLKLKLRPPSVKGWHLT